MWCFAVFLLLGWINRSEAISVRKCYCWVRSRSVMTWIAQGKLCHGKITQRSLWTNSMFYGSVDRWSQNTPSMKDDPHLLAELLPHSLKSFPALLHCSKRGGGKEDYQHWSNVRGLILNAWCANNNLIFQSSQVPSAAIYFTWNWSFPPQDSELAALKAILCIYFQHKGTEQLKVICKCQQPLPLL